MQTKKRTYELKTKHKSQFVKSMKQKNHNTQACKNSKKEKKHKVKDMRLEKSKQG